VFAARKLLKSEPDTDLGIGTVPVLSTGINDEDDVIADDADADDNDDDKNDNADADDVDNDDDGFCFNDPANSCGFGFLPAAFLRANAAPLFADVARLVIFSLRERICVVCPETKFENANVASRATFSESALGRELTMAII
jgi:hypothetical protein